MVQKLLVLGIESSCDETGAALVEFEASAAVTQIPSLLSHALFSQIEMLFFLFFVPSCVSKPTGGDLKIMVFYYCIS